MDSDKELRLSVSDSLSWRMFSCLFDSSGGMSKTFNMSQITITRELASSGVRVMRGKDWEWHGQDGGVGSFGTIMDGPDTSGWVPVRWDNGGLHKYRVGYQGKYDLCMPNPFVASNKPIPNPRSTHSSQRVWTLREELSNISAEKINSIIEKSNTNGHNTIRTTSTSAIKVRRPIIKIKGAKG